MEAIFHTPVCPGEAPGRKRLAEQVIGDFAGGLVGGLADPGDLCDRLQAWPLMLFLRPIDMGRDDGGAGFNAAVIGIDRGVSGCGFRLRIVKEGADIGVQRALIALEAKT